MTHVDELVSGLLTDLYIAGKPTPAPAAGASRCATRPRPR